MSDNVTVTAGSGTVIAADEVADGTLGTVKVQYVKLMDGAIDGTNKAGVSSNGLKVDGSAVTQPVSASALPLPTGASTSAKQPALGTAGTASTDVLSVQGIAGGVAQPVSASALPLPTGAATSAKQPALGTAGTAATDVISVQGIAGGTAQPVSAAALPLPTGAAVSAKQPALGIAGTASTDVVTVQGIAGAVAMPVDGSGVTQPVSMATPPTGAATSAKQPALGTAGTAATDVITVQGIAGAVALKVDGSAVTQPVSMSTLPTGASTSAKQPALGTAGTASTDVISVQGIAGAVALKVDGSGVTQPVSNASLPLPAGAATSAKQPALGTAGSASADVITVQGATSMTALKVDGSGVTQPVSNASLPLPAGAATSAKQPALGTAGSASADVITVQGIASGTPQPIKIDQTTPGTTNNVTMDAVADNAQISGTVSSAATIVTFNTQGYAAVVFQFTSVGSNNTVVVESSNDGTPGTGTTFNASNIYNASSATVAVAASVAPSSTVVYYAPVSGSTMRIRVSGYSSGTITVAGTLKRTFYSGSTATNITAVPSSSAGISIVPTVTSAVASNLIAKASAGNLYRAAITTGSSAGYLMIFNATTAPADGTVTPTICRAVAANASLEVDHSSMPDRFSTGITLVFSTTGPYTKTASATAALEASIF